MKNILLTTALSTFFFSCENNYEKLKGHWHLFEINEYSFIDTKKYYTIDFKENQSATFEENGFFNLSLTGEVNVKNKTVLIGGECNVLDFKYEWKNDSLFLSQIHHDKIFFAEKCGAGCCDKQMDFFNEFELIVDLPVITDTSSAFSIDPYHSLIEGKITIGIPRRGCFRLPRLFLDERAAHVEDIDIWHKIKSKALPNNSTDNIFFTVFSNKKTDLNLLFEIINELKLLEVKTIYLALKNEDIKKEFKVWRKKIDLNDPDLKTIIENHYEEF